MTLIDRSSRRLERQQQQEPPRSQWEHQPTNQPSIYCSSLLTLESRVLVSSYYYPPPSFSSALSWAEALWGCSLLSFNQNIHDVRVLQYKQSSLHQSNVCQRKRIGGTIRCPSQRKVRCFYFILYLTNIGGCWYFWLAWTCTGCPGANIYVSTCSER